MSPVQFKFKKANTSAKIVEFDEFPNWKDLTSKIAYNFGISEGYVGVAYIDKVRETVALNNEEDLQVFYGSLKQPSEQIKLVVHDLKVPDPSIPATWSMDSLKSQDNFKLFCCILGSDRIFPVDIAKNETVGDLKETIKKKKEPELDYLPADALDLWQVSIPADASIKDKLNKLVLDEDESLLPAKRLFKVFLDQPEEEHLHIVVRVPPVVLPSLQTHSITPPGLWLSFEQVDLKIQKTREEIRPAMEKFLRDPIPPAWIPSSTIVDPDHRKFLNDLCIPTYEDGSPSLLLHNLANADKSDVKEIFGDGRHRFICNTSGSGKTRRLLEGLSQHWGFYFVAAVDTNRVGVVDMNVAMSACSNHLDWTEDLRLCPVDQQASRSAVNRHIAANVFMKVLAARIVVFELFLELAVQMDGHLRQQHRHAWLMFQISNVLDRSEHDRHPFLTVHNDCLRGAVPDALIQLVERLIAIRKKYFPRTPYFFSVLDEAQVAARSSPYAFISSVDPGKTRSKLREMIHVQAALNFPFLTLVVSGTGLSLNTVNEVLTSGVGKPPTDGGFLIFHDLGNFSTRKSQRAYLDRYVPQSVLTSSSGHILCKRICDWLLGRHRFTATFIELFLKNGFHSPHRLFNAYIDAYANYSPLDYPYTLLAEERELQMKVEVRSFDWEKLKQDLGAMTEVAAIVHSHMTKKGAPTFGPVGANLVEYGIAQLREDFTGKICEPLALVSVVRWFESQEGFHLEDNLRRRLADPTSRGAAFEELMILYITKKFRDPTRIDEVFEFHGTPPDWASQSARLVCRTHRNDFRPVDLDTQRPVIPGAGVAYYASNPQEVIQWLTKSSAGWCLPGDLFGPDLLAWLSLSSGERRLLMLQEKSYLTGNINSVAAKTSADAVRSLTVNHWFKNSPPADRDRLITMIGKLKVLRVVAAYPLRINLDAKSAVLAGVLSNIGNEPLATLHPDPFLASLKSENEQDDLLIGMEYALGLKRKRGVMIHTPRNRKPRTS